MTRSMSRSLLTLVVAVALTGCAAQKPMIKTRLVTLEGAMPQQQPAPLTRSLFDKPADRQRKDLACAQKHALL